MDEIAAEAGVSKPVLYRHFTDKGDLYLAVGQWGTSLLMERIGPALTECGSPKERIRRIINAYLSVIEQYPDLYRFVVRRTFAERVVDADPVTAEKTLIANTLSRLLGEYTRSLGLDSGGVEPWSHGLVGMVQASGDWWLERQSMSRDDLTEYLTRIIWFALDGVLRSGGIVIDPDQPLELDTRLNIVYEPQEDSGQPPAGTPPTGAPPTGAEAERSR